MTHVDRLSAELGTPGPLTKAAIQVVRAGAKDIDDIRTMYLCDRALLEMLGTKGKTMINDQKNAAERETFGTRSGAMRVREDPQLAEALYRSCRAQHAAIDRLLAMLVTKVEGFLPSKDAPFALDASSEALIAMARVDGNHTEVARLAQMSRAARIAHGTAHYAEMARQAAHRTGETPLPEHTDFPADTITLMNEGRL